MKISLTLIVFVVITVGYSQELTFSQPIKLGSQINSDDEELNSLLSPDGKTLYFSRAFSERNKGGKYAGSDIWVSKKDESGNWLPAVNVANSWNNKLSNAVIGMNQDQSVIYLLNAYSNKSGISFSKFYSGKWGTPEFIPIKGINRNDFVGFYANPKFDVILVSMRGKDSFGEEDLYVSLKDSFGNWTEPKNLGATINTTGFEISPFLTADKKRLFFSSNGHGGFGDSDIFYCDRLFDSWETWSVPRNLGEKVNSKFFDAYFSTFNDSTAYFSSNRTRENSDIYQISLKKFSGDILAGKHFLTKEELTSIFGNSIQTIFEFGEDAISLKDQKRELLLYIVNKIASYPEVHLHLSAYALANTESQNTAIKRIQALINEIKITGLDLDKISYYVNTSTDSTNNRIEVSFYR
jgi:hypothetical protein